MTDNYNRMTSAGSSVTLTYDSNGNLKKVVNGSTTWNYYYNANNELTGVSKNSVTVENSTYNMDSGNRIEQTTGSANMIYSYQGSNNILFQKNLTSSTIMKNYYADGLLLGTSVGSSTYYLLDDLLGSVRSVTTSSPISTVYSSNYKPFGESYGATQSMSLPSIFDYYYTHKPYDSTTGLYYYGARFYDPSINRFITEDSSEYSTITNPITLNQYVYALNNPETNNDPTGHMYEISTYNGSSNYDYNAVPVETDSSSTGSNDEEKNTPQSGAYNYRMRNLMSTTNHFDYQASIEHYSTPVTTTTTTTTTRTTTTTTATSGSAGPTNSVTQSQTTTTTTTTTTYTSTRTTSTSEDSGSGNGSGNPFTGIGDAARQLVNTIKSDIEPWPWYGKIGAGVGLVALGGVAIFGIPFVAAAGVGGTAGLGLIPTIFAVYGEAAFGGLAIGAGVALIIYGAREAP